MRHLRILISLRGKLIIYYTILISVILLVQVAINFFVNTRLIKQNTQINIIDSSTQVVNNIELSLQRIVYFSRIMPYAPETQTTLKMMNSINDIYSLTAAKLCTQLDNTISGYDFNGIPIVSITIYITPDRIYTYKGNISKPMESLDLATFHIFDPNMLWNMEPEFEGSRKLQIIYQRIIYDTETLTQLGLLQVRMDSTAITDIIDSPVSSDNRQIFLVDQDGNILSSKGQLLDEGEIYEIINNDVAKQNTNVRLETNINSLDFMILSDVIESMGWQVINVVQMDSMLRPVIRSQFLVISIGLAGLLLSIMMSAVISSSVTRPIRQIAEAMNQVGKGNLNVRIEDKSSQESYALSNGYENMRRELVDHIQREVALSRIQAEAEFATLQAQINPHFLFNALETLNSKLLTEGNFETSNFVANLGNLLRYSILQSAKVVELGTELKYVDHYLQIQKVRFGKKLTYKINVNNNIKNIKILKFIVQPLVENAVVHGIERQNMDGYVWVTCDTVGEKLKICVGDTGVGMDRSTIDQIMVANAESESEGHMKLGIQNVAKRIRLYYGPQYGIEINSVVGEGTTMILNLPAKISRVEDNNKSEPR